MKCLSVADNCPTFKGYGRRSLPPNICAWQAPLSWLGKLCVQLQVSANREKRTATALCDVWDHRTVWFSWTKCRFAVYFFSFFCMCYSVYILLGEEELLTAQNLIHILFICLHIIKIMKSSYSVWLGCSILKGLSIKQLYRPVAFPDSSYHILKYIFSLLYLNHRYRHSRRYEDEKSNISALLLRFEI